MLFVKFEEYLHYEKKFSSNTISAYLRDLKSFQFFLYQRGDKISRETNYSFIRQWIVHLSENKYSKVSINRKIASLKSYFNFLVNIGELNSSPLKAHKNLKSSSNIVIPFSETEIEKVFESFKFIEGNDRDKLIVELFYFTGMRREELLNIKIINIDFDSHWIKILGKRDKERIIPMLPKLSKSILNYYTILM